MCIAPLPERQPKPVYQHLAARSQRSMADHLNVIACTSATAPFAYGQGLPHPHQVGRPSFGQVTCLHILFVRQLEVQRCRLCEVKQQDGSVISVLNPNGD